MLKDVSLSTVRAFEAAARDGSFSGPRAVELNLSPSAISHAILKLEQSLGATCSSATAARCASATDGEILDAPCRRCAFDELRRGSGGGVRPRLAAAAAVLGAELRRAMAVARLPDFFAAFPDIEVRLAAGTDLHLLRQ